MCVLVVKQNKDGNPDRSKSCIVILGNFQDHVYSKSAKYALVLKYSSLCLLVSKAVGPKHILQQGDCKNAFCQATLPEDEQMAVPLPVGDPAYGKDEFWLLNKKLYGLYCSPHHWYNKSKFILKDLHLSSTPHDPYLFLGIVGETPAPSG